ncbi:MAG: epimerase, partial [Gammaproteobacteria bacterium]
MHLHRIIAGGTGFVGQYLVKNWLKKNFNVTVISRKKQTIQDVFGSTVTGLSWEEFEDAPISLLHSSSLIVNLTGASIGDSRWSIARKQEIIQSRIHSTKLLSNLCAIKADHSPLFFNASAVGVYGINDYPNQVVDEDTDIDFDHAHDFLAQVARPWETATAIAKAHGVHVINMRFGAVLGKNGGMLKKLLLPYKMGLGGVIGTGKQPISWIHIDDVANIIEFLVSHTELHGGINFT